MAQEQLIWCKLKLKKENIEIVFVEAHIVKDVDYKMIQIEKYLEK
jgi:hypothetical protein